MLAIAALLLVAGTAASLVRSGTDRTLARTGQGRVLVEAGEAALCEAVAWIRLSIHERRAHPPETTSEWSARILDACGAYASTPLTRPATGAVQPTQVRALYRELAGSAVRIEDVSVAVEPVVRIAPGAFAQGWIETAVIVRGDGALSQRRRVSQRRIFHITGEGAQRRLTLLSEPIGTVIE